MFENSKSKAKPGRSQGPGTRDRKFPHWSLHFFFEIFWFLTLKGHVERESTRGKPRSKVNPGFKAADLHDLKPSVITIY